jgi:hypothetical protein
MTAKVIYNLLSTSTAIAALVSDRIFPSRRLQESDLPAITYQNISNSPLNTKDGVSLLDTERFSVNVWSTSYTNAAEIANLIRTRLDRYRGILEGVNVDKIIFSDQNDMYEDWSEVHHIVLDFTIRVKR